MSTWLDFISSARLVNKKKMCINIWSQKLDELNRTLSCRSCDDKLNDVKYSPVSLEVGTQSRVKATRESSQVFICESFWSARVSFLRLRCRRQCVNSEQKSIIYNIRRRLRIVWNERCRRTLKKFHFYLKHFSFSRISHSRCFSFCDICATRVCASSKTRNAYRSTFSMPCSDCRPRHISVSRRCRLKSWRETDEMSHHFISI